MLLRVAFCGALGTLVTARLRVPSLPRAAPIAAPVPRLSTNKQSPNTYSYIRSVRVARIGSASCVCLHSPSSTAPSSSSTAPSRPSASRSSLDFSPRHSWEALQLCFAGIRHVTTFTYAVLLFGLWVVLNGFI